VLPATLTTPGAVSSWCEAHAAYGRLPLARNLEAAIGYARDGFAVTERLAGWIAQTAAELALQPEAAAIFPPGGAAPRAGATLANPNLARTLGAIAQGGHAAFHEGDLAAEFRALREGTRRIFHRRRLSPRSPRAGASRSPAAIAA
jgi:gamma-glutamyltranspeptidase/glutathione hydrolase